MGPVYDFRLAFFDVFFHVAAGTALVPGDSAVRMTLTALVPEPATIGMALVAVGGFGLVRRRS